VTSVQSIGSSVCNDAIAACSTYGPRPRSAIARSSTSRLARDLRRVPKPLPSAQQAPQREWAAQLDIEEHELPQMLAAANDYRRKRGLPEVTVAQLQAQVDGVELMCEAASSGLNG
jgi:hypothetical protein